MTKSQINKLGKTIRHKLRDGVELAEDDLLLLQNYRTSFKEDLAPVFSCVSKLSKEERSDCIVSFRIKRIESILSKIKREPTMSLGNMGDIAGCRIILYDDSILRKLVHTINLTFKVLDYNDYILNPKPDGYTGYHLYLESPINKDKTIEIQLRSMPTHKWSSLVEMIDILFDLKLKEGQVHPELQEFLYLLSLPNEKLNVDDKKTIINIDRKFEIYSKLNKIFIKNHISVRKYWLDIVSQGSNSYFIIEIDSEKQSKITSISDYQEAEKKYFEMFLSNRNSNFVLTHIEKPNYRKICVAYASYVMVKHDYLSDWNNFAKEIIKHDSEKNVSKGLKPYYDYVERNLNDQINLIKTERDEVLSQVEKDNGNQSEGITEWIKELNERNEKLVVEINELKEFKPKRSFWSRLFES